MPLLSELLVVLEYARSARFEIDRTDGGPP